MKKIKIFQKNKKEVKQLKKIYFLLKENLKKKMIII